MTRQTIPAIERPTWLSDEISYNEDTHGFRSQRCPDTQKFPNPSVQIDIYDSKDGTFRVLVDFILSRDSDAVYTFKSGREAFLFAQHALIFLEGLDDFAKDMGNCYFNAREVLHYYGHRLSDLKAFIQEAG